MELCKCGTCEQAFERARGLFQKMMKDNECPIFIEAIAVSLLFFADNGILQLRAPGRPNILDRAINEMAQNAIFDKVEAVASPRIKETNKFICDLIIEQKERMKS